MYSGRKHWKNIGGVCVPLSSGNPLVVPGEQITGLLIKNMKRYLEQGLELQGLSDILPMLSSRVHLSLKASIAHEILIREFSSAHATDTR